MKNISNIRRILLGSVFFCALMLVSLGLFVQPAEAITYGSEGEFSSAPTTYVAVASLSSTQFVVAYNNNNTNVAVARVGTIDPFDNSITYSTSTPNFNNGFNDTLDISITSLSSTQYVVA